MAALEAAILDRAFRADAGDWPPAIAEAMLKAAFKQEDREQMILLLEKAKSGQLLPEEAEALENYRHAGRPLELMKSKARRSLGAAHQVPTA